MEVTLDEINKIGKAMMKGKIVEVNWDDQHNGNFKLANCIVELKDGRFARVDCDIHTFPFDYQKICIYNR